MKVETAGGGTSCFGSCSLRRGQPCEHRRTFDRDGVVFVFKGRQAAQDSLRFQLHLILLMIAVVLVLNVAHLVEVATARLCKAIFLISSRRLVRLERAN